MSDIKDMINTNTGVIDHGIRCDNCEYDIEDGLTGYWKDNRTGVWCDGRYCCICVWNFVNLPKRISAQEIRERRRIREEREEQARLEQERLSVPESERRRIREEREERERQSRIEYEEECEEREREREEQAAEQRERYSMSDADQDYDWLQRAANKLWSNHVTPITSNGENSRSYDWDPKPGFEDDSSLFREYCDRQEDEDNEEDLFQLPSTVEELYEYLDEQLTSQEVSIIPQDAFKLDEEFIYCETYDEAKKVLTEAIFEKQDTFQNLVNMYIVSQHNDRFWYALSPVQDNPNKFNISLFAQKDEVATKYLIRQLEECVYHIDYILNPDDYKGEDVDLYATEEEADHYLKTQAPCFMCNEYNYTNVMCDAGRMRIICRDCYPKVKQCDECETITKDTTFYNFDTGARLCFDCNFKTEERVQMPLEEHLLVRRDIQHLRRPYFDVLVDYAELAEFTIFDAYHYKSRCHFHDCIQRMSPSGWCAEETLAFCCRRHVEHADEVGCHCTNVWNGTDYDDHYEEATCKICNSPHEANVASRVALRESGQGVKPIVSAICMFEEICMSNVLFTSLVDLSQYFM